MKLRSKVALLVAAVLVLMSALTSSVTGMLVISALRTNLEAKGISIATNLTAQIARHIIDNNPLVIQRGLEDYVSGDVDARYAYVIGFDGELLAHTFDNGFPLDLLDVNMLPDNIAVGSVSVRFGKEAISDIGRRVIAGNQAEVHIGLSRRMVENQVSRLKTILYLLSLTALAATVIASTVITNYFTRPLLALTQHASRFGATRQHQEIEIVSNDEIGDLTRVYNLMAAGLEQSLRRTEESEKKYRTLVEMAQEGVGSFDAGNQVTFVNRRFSETLKLPADEILGRWIGDFVAEKDHPKLAGIINGLRLGNSGQHELVLKKSDGALVFAIVSAAPLMSESGEFAGAFAVVTDVTDLRRAKEELERQNQELKKLDKLKDGLIRDVSHELKTPVAKQAMQLELLRDLIKRCNLEKDAEAIIKVMERSIKRQEQVIHNILDLHRLELNKVRYDIREVRLDLLLDSVLDDYAEVIAALEVIVDRKISPVFALSDENMLWHVFSNLINNAIKFRRSGVRPQLTISLSEDDNYCAVSFADNGIGLDPKDKERVFERFYQVSPSFEGSGVGLSICKMIVEDLGGAITLDSDGPNQGATVTVKIPLPHRQLTFDAASI